MGSQKYKGQSGKVAMKLFGLPKGKLMESPIERQHMIDVLSLSANPFMKELVRCARSPEWARTSFAKIMEQCAIPGENVMREYAAIQRTRGIQGMAFHLPDIMQQTALAALIHEETCPRCKGRNSHRVRLKNLKYGNCPKCDGHGKVRVDADPESLKLVFNTFGLTNQGANASVSASVNVNVDVGQSMEDLSRDVASIVSGEGKMS